MEKSNPQLARKAYGILLELTEHPRTGIGHPEPLKGGNDITIRDALRLTTASSTISMTIA